jgi:hypothetical protein
MPTYLRYLTEAGTFSAEHANRSPGLALADRLSTATFDVSMLRSILTLAHEGGSVLDQRSQADGEEGRMPFWGS